MRRRFLKERHIERFQVFPKRVFVKGGRPRQNIVLAKLKFRGGKTKTVVARSFVGFGIASEREFNEMILRFRKAGIRIPKTWVVEHNGALWQVMELFSAAGKSKFLPNEKGYARFDSLTLRDGPMLLGVARDYAKMFNCGYVPGEIDVENYLRTRSGETYYFIDLHYISKMNKRTLLRDMQYFYETNTIKDPDSKALFVQKFRRTLKPRLREYWDRAVKRSGR